MANVLPVSLRQTMHEKYVFEAMSDSALLPGLPRYVEGSYWFPEEYADRVSRLSARAQEDELGAAIARAHARWRRTESVYALILSEECFGSCLNAFAEAALAGPEIFLAWTKMFQKLFEPAGFDLYQEPDIQGFEQQFRWVQEIDCMAPPLAIMALLRLRRKLVEEKRLIGKRDLFSHVMLPINDVLCSTLSPTDSPEMKRYKREVHHRMYGETADLPFPLTRQMILGNGGGSPVEW